MERENFFKLKSLTHQIDNLNKEFDIIKEQLRIQYKIISILKNNLKDLDFLNDPESLSFFGNKVLNSGIRSIFQNSDFLIKSEDLYADLIINFIKKINIIIPKIIDNIKNEKLDNFHKSTIKNLFQSIYAIHTQNITKHINENEIKNLFSNLNNILTKEDLTKYRDWDLVYMFGGIAHSNCLYIDTQYPYKFLKEILQPNRNLNIFQLLLIISILLSFNHSYINIIENKLNQENNLSLKTIFEQLDKLLNINTIIKLKNKDKNTLYHMLKTKTKQFLNDSLKKKLLNSLKHIKFNSKDLYNIFNILISDNFQDTLNAEIDIIEIFFSYFDTNDVEKININTLCELFKIIQKLPHITVKQIKIFEKIINIILDKKNELDSKNIANIMIGIGELSEFYTMQLLKYTKEEFFATITKIIKEEKDIDPHIINNLMYGINHCGKITSKQYINTMFTKIDTNINDFNFEQIINILYGLKNVPENKIKEHYNTIKKLLDILNKKLDNKQFSENKVEASLGKLTKSMLNLQNQNDFHYCIEYIFIKLLDEILTKEREDIKLNILYNISNLIYTKSQFQNLKTYIINTFIPNINFNAINQEHYIVILVRSYAMLNIPLQNNENEEYKIYLEKQKQNSEQNRDFSLLNEIKQALSNNDKIVIYHYLDGIELDLYIEKLNLNIEIDGTYHSTKMNFDNIRDIFLLKKHEIKTIRIKIAHLFENNKLNKKKLMEIIKIKIKQEQK